MEIVRIPENDSESEFAANCYVVKDGADAAVVDPSAPLRLIDGAVAGSKVRYILLTHGHFDHILTLSAVRERYGAPVVIHKGDADFLSDPEKSLFFQACGERTVFAPAETVLDGSGKLPFGDGEFCVLHTPGHTEGSVCYTFRDVMLSGDTLFDLSVGRTDFPGGDRAAQRETLRLLKQLPDMRVYPGHGPETTLDEQKKHNPYMNGDW